MKQIKIEFIHQTDTLVTVGVVCPQYRIAGREREAANTYFFEMMF